MPKRILTGSERVQVLALMAATIATRPDIAGIGDSADVASKLLEAVEAHELQQMSPQKEDA